MNIMMSLGWAGCALLIGVLLRAKIPVLQKMLVPASVLAGIIGVVVMNLGLDLGTTSENFTDIVNELFTISFISIGLTEASSGNKGEKQDGKGKNSTVKSIMRGCFGMGLVWCILYALTPVVGYFLVKLTGASAGMDAVYGTLIPFAFTQGPGQAASFGALYESYGWENAAMVGVTFAAVGFLASFLIGVPIAKFGISHRLAKNTGKIDSIVSRGYYRKEEQVEYIGMDTMYGGNIETLTFHVALIGLCYVLAVGLSKLFALIPGFFGGAMSGMLFMNGMLTSNLVRWIMKKLHLDFLNDNTLQRKFTGFTADMLVVCSFMAVKFSIIGKWLVPILVEVIAVTLITVVICMYFGPRFGDAHDFERTLGLFGTSTGTVPSGIALVRIVDPSLQSTTAVELGMMNYVMLFCTPVYFILLAIAAGKLSVDIAVGILAGLVVVYLILLKVFHVWGKPTFSWSRSDEGKKAEQK